MEAVVDELCAKWRAEADAAAAAAATPEPEQAPELSHTEPLEIPAPRPSPEPQTQADVVPEPQAQALADSPQNPKWRSNYDRQVWSCPELPAARRPRTALVCRGCRTSGSVVAHLWTTPPEAEAEPELETRVMSEWPSPTRLPSWPHSSRTCAASSRGSGPSLSAWDSRLEREGIGATLMIRLEIKKLSRRLDEALAKNQLTPPPAPWWVVDEDQGQKMLAELRSWIEDHAKKALPGLHGPASGVLAEPSRGGMGAEHAQSRVGPRSTATRTAGTWRGPCGGMSAGCPG